MRDRPLPAAPNTQAALRLGGAKVMMAFGVLPEERRTPLIENAIQHGVDSHLQHRSGRSNFFPAVGVPSPVRGNWVEVLGFPVLFYVTDLLQIVEALVGLGYGHDPRLENALTLIREKQDENGRWPF